MRAADIGIVSLNLHHTIGAHHRGRIAARPVFVICRSSALHESRQAPVLIETGSIDLDHVLDSGRHGVLHYWHLGRDTQP